MARAGLLLVAVLGAGILGDALAIGDLGLEGGQADLELGLGTPDGNIDMLVAHALQDGLAGGLLVVPAQGHILFAQARQ